MPGHLHHTDRLSRCRYRQPTRQRRRQSSHRHACTAPHQAGVPSARFQRSARAGRMSTRATQSTRPRRIEDALTRGCQDETKAQELPKKDKDHRLTALYGATITNGFRCGPHLGESRNACYGPGKAGPGRCSRRARMHDGCSAVLPPAFCKDAIFLLGAGDE